MPGPHLIVDSAAPSGIPDARDRLLAKRSDATEPTLVFSDEEMALMDTILRQV